MLLQNYTPFIGQHCETTATGGLLQHLGIELSEPMLFGIGEGLGFVFWRMKTMDFPFIGGRVKTDKLTEHICRNLKLELAVKETASLKKAWENIAKPLSEGKPVGLKLDCYHLDYFTNKIHFAGHYATIYGFDNQWVYLNDTDQQGCLVTTSLESLARARNEKGPMSSRNLSFTIAQTQPLPPLATVIKQAITNNADEFLHPPIKNLGYKGIKKTASEIKKWFWDSKDPENEFQTSAMLMERAGTGGALFRNLYRDFLLEAYEITGLPAIKEGHKEYAAHARKWSEIASLFLKIGETKDEKYVNQAAEILLDLSEKERETIAKLKSAFEI